MAKATKLKCGITLVTEQNESIRSAALGIWVRSGSVYEKNENNGVSHFIEHMMFKGTKNRTARQIAEDMDKIGASSNALTGKESTCYYVKTQTSKIYEGAEILIDMVLNSKFLSKEMDKERKVILEEIKMVKDSPDDEIYDTIAELIHKGNPLGRSILGTPDSLAIIHKKELVDYYRDHYTRDSIVIAVAGNFDEDRIISLFENKMTSLNEKSPKTKRTIKPYKQSFDVKVKDIEQTHICLATPSVSYADDQYYSFVLMNSIFGGSMSSRLFQNIREQQGLAYSVCSMNGFSSFAGFFNIYAGVAHENIDKTISSIRHELEDLATHGITEEELEMAKEQVKSAYIFSLENTTTMMFSLGRNKLLFDKLFSVDKNIEHFNNVTRKDIHKAAEMIADLSNYCGAVVTGKEIDIRELIVNGNKN